MIRVNVTVKRMKWYKTFGEIKIFEQAFYGGLELCGKDLTSQKQLESANIRIIEDITEIYR
ncbi:MAG: hypothetical protein LWW97_04930 [Deltaproteobacteria bacterium]|nr:hypothetical protein [Deltaproteobacteria bacterium]